MKKVHMGCISLVSSHTTRFVTLSLCHPTKNFCCFFSLAIILPKTPCPVHEELGKGHYF